MISFAQSGKHCSHYVHYVQCSNKYCAFKWYWYLCLFFNNSHSISKYLTNTTVFLPRGTLRYNGVHKCEQKNWRKGVLYFFFSFFIFSSKGQVTCIWCLSENIDFQEKRGVVEKNWQGGQIWCETVRRPMFKHVYTNSATTSKYVWHTNLYDGLRWWWTCMASSTILNSCAIQWKIKFQSEASLIQSWRM